MFRATISDVNLLRDSISTIAELIDEGVFRITENDLSMVAADRAMVAVVDFRILANAFDKFETDKDYSIGLNIGNLLSVLKRAGSGDRITFTLQDAKLEIVMENSSKRRFVIPLLDISQEEVPPIDQLVFTAKAAIKPDIMESGIADAEVVADAILFEGGVDKFCMKAEGDVSSTQLELEKGNEALKDLRADADVKARYPLDYLKKMIKAAKIADVVSIEWGKDYPMKLGFKAADKASLTMILAPRVVESD
jgi:proliferating cell nuclear antigen